MEETKLDRQEQLDLGYDALRAEEYDNAQEIFQILLDEKPDCGLSCLGSYMAQHMLSTREELAEDWEAIRTEPDFLKAMEPAENGFLDWLRGDMEQAEENIETAEEESLLEEESGLYWDLSSIGLDFSLMSPGRKLLLLFSAVQVLLYFGVSACFFSAEPDRPEFWGPFLGALMMGALVCGLPVILGSVYGNSIVEAGRFCRVLKILNNVVGGLGGFGSGFMAFILFSEMQEVAVPAREDQYFFYAFVIACIVHVLALVVPIILDAVEYG